MANLTKDEQDKAEISWSNISSNHESIQDNTYLNLRRQMQDMEHSNVSMESQAIKYDIGLDFNKKSNFNSYGYYADEEKDLKENENKRISEPEFENQFLKQTSENYLESGNADEYLAKNRLRKFQMYHSGLDSDITTEKNETSINESKQGEQKLEIKIVKKDNNSHPVSVTSPISPENKATKLFKNEYITSIGKIELQGSRNEIHYSNFVNKVNNLKELSELFDKKKIKNDSSMDNLNEIAINLQNFTQKNDLKNLSFKVFDVEKDFKNMTFNHFIDVTTDVENDSKEPSVKAEEQKNWSNVRAFGTGNNIGVMSDNMDTNNTVNFLITNNSVNYMRLDASVSTDLKNVPSKFSQTKNTSEFQTQSK